MRQLHMLFALQCVIANLVLLSWSCCYADEDPVRKRVNTIASRYLLNRESFDHLECRYEFRQFNPGTELRAIEGEGELLGDAQGLLIRKGEKIRCENNLGEQALKIAKTEGKCCYLPRRVLYQGNEGVTYSPILEGGVLYSDRYVPEGLPLTPFDFGGFSGVSAPNHPGFILLSGWMKDPRITVGFQVEENCRVEEPHARYVPSKEGLLLLKYTIQLGKDTLEMRFYVDPDLGHMSVLSEKLVNQVPISRAIVKDVKKLGDGRAFPMKSVSYSFGLNSDNEEVVNFANETVVTEFSMGGEIDELQFQLSISESQCYSVFRDLAVEGSQFRYNKKNVITLSDLPVLYNLAARQAENE